MKVAVTGAAGFVGRQVLAQLRRRDVEIVAVLRSDAQNPDPTSVPYVNFDIQNTCSDVYERLGRPDALIHLAWGGLPNYASPHHFERELPVHYRFLQDLIAGGLPALTVAGTCFEYGMQSGCISEGAITNPANPYAYAKDALRRQLTFLQETRAFRLNWCRMFYLYGPGQNPTSLYPQLESALARGDRVFNMSGGEQLRDYLSVHLAAEYLVLLTLSEVDVGVVNICSGRPISVRRLVEEWMRSKGQTIELNLGYYPYPKYEPMAFWGSADKLNSILASR